MFQNYREALFPWLRAFDNIAYPLKLMRVPQAERRARAEELVAHLGIKLDLKLYPYQMSGGQQQLVSIMRALVVEPEILFLDEPFSALDYEMTLFMREQLQRIFMETGTTTVLVSHDLEEAVYLADRVLLLSRHPARVADFTPVTARRGRAPTTTLSDPDFVRTKAHCLDVFQREVQARMKPDNSNAFLPILGVAGLLAIWSLATWRNGSIRCCCRRRSRPSRRCGRAWMAARSASTSSRRCIAPRPATLIAAVIAIPLGIVLGSSERLYRSLEFVIDFFRSTPASAMFPLFLVLFGVGDETKISVAAFGAMLVILFNVAYGVMNARKTRLLAAKVMGASRLRMLFDVMLLESLPQTFVGLRNGVSLALVIIVVAEMFIGSQDGLGHSVFEAQQLFDMPRHVCGYLRRRRARLWAQSAVPHDRAALRALVRQIGTMPMADLSSHPQIRARTGAAHPRPRRESGRGARCPSGGNRGSQPEAQCDRYACRRTGARRRARRPKRQL